MYIHIQHNIKESKRDLEFSVGEHKDYYSFGMILAFRNTLPPPSIVGTLLIRLYDVTSPKTDSNHVKEKLSQNLVHFTCVPNKITHPSIIDPRISIVSTKNARTQQTKPVTYRCREEFQPRSYCETPLTEMPRNRGIGRVKLIALGVITKNVRSHLHLPWHGVHIQK